MSMCERLVMESAEERERERERERETRFHQIRSQLSTYGHERLATELSDEREAWFSHHRERKEKAFVTAH